MPQTVTCLACGVQREATDDELRARTVSPCACGNGTYMGIDWRTFTPPPEPAPEAPPEGSP